MSSIFQKVVIVGSVILFQSLVYIPTIKANDPVVEQVTKLEKDDKVKEFYVDKHLNKKELIVVDSLLMLAELEEEELLFPADNIYSHWQTNGVNPYAQISIPDSFNIDVSTFVMPFEGRVTSHFGPRRKRMHYGTDIKVQTGDTILAAFDGKVRVKSFDRRGYGNYLVLRHNNGLETVYGHLSGFIVDSEEVVKAGQPIGLGGNTGRSTGSHLHFEFRFIGKPINPIEIIDFANFVAHTDNYTFVKKKQEAASNKYTKGQVQYHKIKSGDTLYAVSKRYKISVQQLCKLNKITATTKLRIGQNIRCS